MRSPTISYPIAVLVLIAAVLLRWMLDPVMGDTLPLVTLFGAVVVAVWLGGYGPAILVTVLGYVVCAYLFIEPRGRFGFDSFGNLVGLIAYLFTCSIIIVLGEAMRRAQVRASEQRELLQVTLASIGDAVITTDLDGHVTYVNAVAESLTGWTLHEAVGQPLDSVFRIVNESTRQPVENPATRALREGVVVGLANHTVLIRKDGHESPIDDSAAAIRDEFGAVSGCVLVFRDVTAQRRLEQEKASQLMTARLLASIVESSDDAIISKSLDGTIQTWNAAAERLFGHTAEEAIGRHISQVIPEERIVEEDDFIARLKAGERIDHFETERTRSDGRRFPVSLTISPIKDASGTVIGASKIVRDITERRRAEDELRRVAADLSEADRRKNEFLAMLAHELRNPLAPISNAVRVLRLADGDGTAIQAASEMLERQVSQMVRLVDDLLDMSRITRGKIELRKTRVELGPIVTQAIEAARVLYRSMNHDLTVKMPLHPIYLDADPTRLAQVVGNLLNNACKFTDKGGHVWLTVEQDGSEAAISIRDNGIGIDPEQIPRLFEMFTQVDASRERSRDGLGIGLTLVKTLVEMQGGTVEVHSAGLGHGSEFVVHLPVVPEPASLLSHEPSGEMRSAQARRVLIVDDNEDAAQWLATLLNFNGHETHVAHDGIEAVQAAEQLLPDVVLLDIGLPRLNGHEVCRRIREQSWGKDLFLVALTGWGQDEDRQKSKEAGFDRHLIKPVDEDVILKLLASVPARRALQQ